MKATTAQIRLIQINKQDENHKEELVQWATNDNTKTSCKDLSFDQANAILVEWFKLRPHEPDVDQEAMKYARFDKNNEQHKRILATLINIGWWIMKKPYGKIADLQRLGKWLQEKAPVRKPLLKMSPTEVSKIIGALDSMTIKKFTPKINKIDR